MTTTAVPDHRDIVATIPRPADIRARLDALRTEARLLRELLPVAERREKLWTRDNDEGDANE